MRNEKQIRAFVLEYELWSIVALVASARRSLLSSLVSLQRKQHNFTHKSYIKIYSS